jgi:PhnB protein
VTEEATLAINTSQAPHAERDDPKESPDGRCRRGLGVPDLDEFHRRMVEKNVPCVQEPKDVFGVRIAQYLDPDELAISVNEARRNRQSHLPIEFLIRQKFGGNMASKVKGVPDAASVVIPRLVCRDPAAEIEFCAKTFGAVERVRRPGQDGTVAHALMAIGPAMLMIESEWPTLPSRAPMPDGTFPVVVFVYVEDVDQAVERAIAAGAKLLIPAKNQFWGDRTAWIMDPSGHVWTIASRIEETSADERKGRWSIILADES